MVTIEAVDARNVFDVCELTTNADGMGTVLEEFLCGNAVSISEAAYFPAMNPRALYEGGCLVGFFMYERTEAQPETATLCRFMIDRRFQGRGLGRQAFARMLDYFRQQGVRRAVLMIDEENVVAKSLYLSFGFSFTGKVEEGERYYDLSL